jgi:SAM-dependent methyltransferase
MPIETIEFEGNHYPLFQTNGNASRFCRPFALEVCKGVGLDIGASKKEWAFPNSIPIDIDFEDEFHAMNLPDYEYDYLHSSHCVEHIKENLADVFDHWATRLKSRGILFLYLPDMDSQKYWRWKNNRKHIHYITPKIMSDYFNANKNFKNVFVSGVDAYNSFTIMCEKV